MSNPNGRGGSLVGFIAFLATMFAAVLYLVSFVLSFFDISFPLFETLQSIASVIMICIVSVTGWRYVKTRSRVWKLIYVLVLLAVVACVVIPVVRQYMF